MPSQFPIILNSSNAIQSDKYKYKYTYKFAQGSINLKNASVAISQIALYYSWPNISKDRYNNSRFFLVFPDGSAEGYTELIIDMPDGHYEIENINQYLQSVLIAQNRFLIAPNGSYVFYFEILVNPQTYSIQLNSFQIPINLEAGYSEPPGGFSFPTEAGQSPTMIIESDNEFGKVIGFTPGLYKNAISNLVPEVSNVSSVLVTCSLINNQFTNPSNIIFSFVSNTTYGKLISVTNPNLIFSNVFPGVYNEVTISFLDNNFKSLDIIDPNLIIYLIIKIDD